MFIFFSNTIDYVYVGVIYIAWIIIKIVDKLSEDRKGRKVIFYTC